MPEKNVSQEGSAEHTSSNAYLTVDITNLLRSSHIGERVFQVVRQRIWKRTDKPIIHGNPEESAFQMRIQSDSPKHHLIFIDVQNFSEITSIWIGNVEDETMQYTPEFLDAYKGVSQEQQEWELDTIADIAYAKLLSQVTVEKIENASQKILENTSHV